MKNSNWGITSFLVLLCLVLGFSVGHYMFPVIKEKVVTETKEVQVPVYQNVTNEVEVADASAYLDDARDTLFDKKGDSSEFLTCGGYEYDEDEVFVDMKKDVKSWSYMWLDDDKYQVDFTAKFKYDDNSDEHACKKVMDVSVYYEDGEKPVVKFG